MSSSFLFPQSSSSSPHERRCVRALGNLRWRPFGPLLARHCCDGRRKWREMALESYPLPPSLLSLESLSERGAGEKGLSLSSLLRFHLNGGGDIINMMAPFISNRILSSFSFSRFMGGHSSQSGGRETALFSISKINAARTLLPQKRGKWTNGHVPGYMGEEISCFYCGFDVWRHFGKIFFGGALRCKSSARNFFLSFSLFFGHASSALS